MGGFTEFTDCLAEQGIEVEAFEGPGDGSRPSIPEGGSMPERPEGDFPQDGSAPSIPADGERPSDERHERIREHLRSRGACFYREIYSAVGGGTDRDVLDALWDDVKTPEP